MFGYDHGARNIVDALPAIHGCDVVAIACGVDIHNIGAYATNACGAGVAYVSCNHVISGVCATVSSIYGCVVGIRDVVLAYASCIKNS